MSATRVLAFRSLADTARTFMDALRSGNLGGVTFSGKRDMYEACGYDRRILLRQYRQRYNRGDVAARVVEAFPESTWRGDGTDAVYDNEDPNTETPFEAGWNELNKRLKLWSAFYRADVLAGLGHYSVLLIGGPGDMASPLPESLKPADVLFVQPFCQEDAPIISYSTDSRDPRYGLPIEYQLRRTATRRDIEFGRAPQSLDLTRPIHWSRVIHIAENALDDEVFGLPRLERVWNRLDDLDKVVGAGSEAFWQRAHQGVQFDVDKDIEFEEDEAKQFREEIENFQHKLTRSIRTRGVKMVPMGSDVAEFDNNVNSIISLISGTTKIPQRILKGAEAGELASTQDRLNWTERVQDRRTRFAEPVVLRAFVDRMVKCKALPTPKYVDTAQLSMLPGGKRNIPGAADSVDNQGESTASKPFAFGNQQRTAVPGLVRPDDGGELSRTDDAIGRAPLTPTLVDPPKPIEKYEVSWPDALDTAQAERVDMAVAAKGLGPTVITDAEIREQLLGLEPMSEQDQAAAKQAAMDAHGMELEKIKAKGPSPFGMDDPGEGAPGAKPGAPGKPNGRPAPRIAAESEHSGLFIYLKLDADAAKSLALKGEGAEDPSTLHITVAYCDGDFDKAVSLVRSVAEKMPMLHGQVTGIGTFAPSIQSDGKTVLWAYPEVDGLEDLHLEILSALELVGIHQRTDRDYRPHITLAYVDAGAELSLPLVDRVPLYFSQLCVMKGEQRVEFWLSNGGPSSVVSSGQY